MQEAQNPLEEYTELIGRRTYLLNKYPSFCTSHLTEYVPRLPAGFCAGLVNRLAVNYRTENEHLRHHILATEKEIVEEIPYEELPEHDLRLRTLSQATALFDRAQLLNFYMTIEFDSIRVESKRVRLNQEYPFDISGIMAINSLLAPFEMEYDYVVKYKAPRIQAEQDVPIDRAIQYAWAEHGRSIISRIGVEQSKA